MPRNRNVGTSVRSAALRVGACALVVGAVLAAGAYSPLAVPVQRISSTLAYEATADARVQQNKPTTNYGTSFLRVDGGVDPLQDSYVQFDVTGVTGPVASATLRLYSYGGTRDPSSVHVAPNTWAESTLTWATRPLPDPVPTASRPSIVTGAHFDYDVTAAVTGDGTYSFVVRVSTEDGIDIRERETATAAERPTLLITLAETLPVTNLAAPTVTGVAQHGASVVARPGSWEGTQPISFAYAWQRCDAAGASCAPIPGATAASYAVEGADVGGTLRVEVTADGADGGSGSALSAPSGVVLPPIDGDPVLAGAGNISDCATNVDDVTSQLLSQIGPDRVFTLGDNVYPSGTPAEYADCYEPNWGQHKAITSPVVGNHDYETPQAAGYFGYFGAAAGDPTEGFYAYDLGAWRVYVLNSTCEIVACGAGSAQEQWLRADLAANPRACTAAAVHHPRFASGTIVDGRDNPQLGALYQAFNEAGGDVWLAAHNHSYERTARIAPSGAVDVAAGTRNFISGTGGVNLGPFGAPIPGSEVRAAVHGVVKLTLHPEAYSWEFVPVPGASGFQDAGSDSCTGPTPDVTPPPSPGSFVADPVAPTRVDLTWMEPTDDFGVVAYDITRDGSPLATTGPTASFSDQGAEPGQSYTYEVRARDAVGNVSLPASSSATTDRIPMQVTFVPAADARLNEASRTRNYGTATQLRIDGGSDPTNESWVRFDLSGLHIPITSARLRVWVLGGSNTGLLVRSGPNNWTELGITWANRPSGSGTFLGSSGPAPTGTWAEIDVTSYITGDGSVTFVLYGTSTDGLDIASRDATDPALRPRLVVWS